MFVFSQLMSAITQPMFWLAVWWFVALGLLSGAARWRRAAVRMLWSGLVVLGLLGFEALPHALLRPLENRYPVPTPEAVGRHVGVIVLGGATEHPGIYMAHGQVPLGQAAERMSVPVGLMRQHTQLQLVFSGGEGRLLGKRCEEPWLLVTSAWHMPRSVPEFEAVGCLVTPYPVDFRTGDATLWAEYSLARSLLLWQTALHEWLGLGG
nr:YdcF family protein [uncultured Limnohabitans sp.]